MYEEITLVEYFTVGVAIGEFAGFIVVVLVVVFGRVKFRGRREFRFDVVAFMLESLNQLLGDLLLVFIDVKDFGTILSAHVGALSVQLSKIVDFEK